jgi:hypothetical protein
MSQKKTKVETKKTAAEKIDQAHWEQMVGLLRSFAVALWNAFPKTAEIKDDNDIRMHLGERRDFEGANAEDFAIVDGRNLFCEQTVIHGNPFISTWDQAFSAWMAGIWKAYATDLEGTGKARITPSELKNIMTASREGNNKDSQREGLYQFMTAAGFDAYQDDQGYTAFRFNAAKHTQTAVQKARKAAMDAIDKLKAEKPFPVSSTRPSKDDATNAKKQRQAQGRNARVHLIVSCGCTYTETRSKAKPFELKVGPAQAKACLGMPCPACGFTDSKKTAINPEGGRYVKATKAVMAKIDKAHKATKATKAKATKAKARKATAKKTATK